MPNKVGYKEFDEVSIYSQSLSEESQKSGMRMAWVTTAKEGNVMCIPWIKCRDFLHDAFRARMWKSKFEIYGCEYIHGQNAPIATSRIRMIMKHLFLKGDKLKAVVDRGVKIINTYEKHAGLKVLTKATELSGCRVCGMICSPHVPRFTSSPVTLSNSQKFLIFSLPAQ